MGWTHNLRPACASRWESTLILTDMAKEDKASSESLRLILVVFLGGCTFSEISALRFLGREKGMRIKRWELGCVGSGRQHALTGRLFFWLSYHGTPLLWLLWQEAGSAVLPGSVHCSTQETLTGIFTFLFFSPLVGDRVSVCCPDVSGPVTLL